MKKTYAIDIDGTLCTHEKDYSKARPYKQRIETVNKLYDLGHKIILHTGRGGTTGKNWQKVTEKQLSNWGVKYHKLYFKGFYYDYWIDDRACNCMPFFGELAEYHLHPKKHPFLHKMAFLITGYDVYGKDGIIKWM